MFNFTKTTIHSALKNKNKLSNELINIAFKSEIDGNNPFCFKVETH